MNKLSLSKKARLLIYSCAGVALLGILLSAGAVAQNAASGNNPTVSDTMLNDNYDVASSDELAALKERIGILEERLKENNRTQLDRSADHDHSSMAQNVEEIGYAEPAAETPVQSFDGGVTHSPANHESHRLSNKIEPDVEGATLTNEVAELKDRIDKLEMELDNGNRPLSNSAVDHDHSTMEHNDGSAMHDENMGNMHGGCMGMMKNH